MDALQRLRNVDIQILLLVAGRPDLPDRQAVVLCPLHDDHTPSLNLGVTFRQGHAQLLAWCGACGDVYLQLVDLASGRPPRPHPARKARHTFRYEGRELARNPAAALRCTLDDVDAWHSRLLESSMRRFEMRGIHKATIIEHRIGLRGDRYSFPCFEEGKLVNVRWWCPDGPDKWLNTKGQPVPLYPDPTLMADRPGDFILLCEGELDTLLAREHGFNAFTFTGAMFHPKAHHLPYFEGRDVAVASTATTRGGPAQRC